MSTPHGDISCTADRADTATRESSVEHLRILSRPDWVEPVVMFLKQRALNTKVCDPATADRLVVALTEAVTNAIVHGNYELSSELKNRHDGSFKKELDARAARAEFAGRIVDVRVEYTPDRCTWVIHDQGQGFDFTKALQRSQSDDPMELLAAGRGITIMRAFVDEVAWRDGGREIHLVLHLDKGIEQRKHRRTPYSAEVAIQLEGDVAPSFRGTARNLSVSGIGCTLDRPIDLDTPLRVVLNAIKPDSSVMPGKVVRCRQIDHAHYDVGIAFDTPTAPIDQA